MPEQNKKKRSFLAIYAVSLLTIALVLIALSYLQQQRANEQIDDLREQHDSFTVSTLASMEDLRSALVELESRNEELENEVDALEEANASLREDKAALGIEKVELAQQITALTTESGALAKLNGEYVELFEALEQTGAVVIERDADGNFVSVSLPSEEPIEE